MLAEGLASGETFCRVREDWSVTRIQLMVWKMVKSVLVSLISTRRCEVN